MKFSSYDYKARKNKVEEILDNTNEVKKVEKFPTDNDFTYTNGYKAWTSAIFVDLRDSTKLFSDKEDVEIAKVIRGFTSEIIEILRKDTTETDLKEIGIRGDCVFAVYSTPTQEDIYDVAFRAIYINTYIAMLNNLLNNRKLPIIKVGIGMDASETLAVKAGRKSSGINNLVWIGKAVSHASKLSDLGNKDGINSIVMGETFYNHFLESPRNTQSEEIKKWFESKYHTNLGTYYHGYIVIQDFNQWIENGMPAN